MDDLTEYLTAMTHLRGERPSYERLVLERGEQFADYGDPIPQMEPKLCFTNCFTAAHVYDDLTYCEGWAAGIIPVHHAWLVDGEGRVVDPTWGHRQGDRYFGIRFTNDEIRETNERTEYGFSMLYPSSRTHPLLHAPCSECAGRGWTVERQDGQWGGQGDIWDCRACEGVGVR